MQPETITYTVTKTVPIADADGQPIREGSVLRRIDDGERGVVDHIVREGIPHHVPLARPGDMAIRLSAGTSRVSNQYAKWRHIPHDEQTYEERYQSWLRRPYDHDDEMGISRDQGLAIDGIMSLLPDDTVDWDYGPHPDRLEDALAFLVAHLKSLTA